MRSAVSETEPGPSGGSPPSRGDGFRHCRRRPHPPAGRAHRQCGGLLSTGGAGIHPRQHGRARSRGGSRGPGLGIAFAPRTGQTGARLPSGTHHGRRRARATAELRAARIAASRLSSGAGRSRLFRRESGIAAAPGPFVPDSDRRRAHCRRLRRTDRSRARSVGRRRSYDPIPGHAGAEWVCPWDNTSPQDGRDRWVRPPK